MGPLWVVLGSPGRGRHRIIHQVSVANRIPLIR